MSSRGHRTSHIGLTTHSGGSRSTSTLTTGSLNLLYHDNISSQLFIKINARCTVSQSLAVNSALSNASCIKFSCLEYAV